jgi:hypothetical protein
MKNSSDTIGNQTRDLQACSTVPQPTVPPAACREVRSAESNVTGYLEGKVTLVKPDILEK